MMLTERDDASQQNGSYMQIHTDRVYPLNRNQILKKSPRIVLKQLKQTKPKEDYQHYAQSMDQRYQQYLRNKKPPQKLRLSECRKRIAQIANTDNRFSLQNLKRKDQVHAQQMICEYINQNKKYYNKLVVKLPSYEKQAPFKVEQYSFIDKILPYSHLVEKKCGFDEDNLYRNHLLLEKVLLERRFKGF